MAGMVLPGSPALRKPVIWENFNGFYRLYEKLVISEGILKQTCSELCMMSFFFFFPPYCRNVSPSLRAANRYGWWVPWGAGSWENSLVAGSAWGVGLHLLPVTVTWLTGCTPFLWKGCSSHYPLSSWMEPSLDLWLKSSLLARGERKIDNPQ